MRNFGGCVIGRPLHAAFLCKLRRRQAQHPAPLRPEARPRALVRRMCPHLQDNLVLSLVYEGEVVVRLSGRNTMILIGIET